MADPNSPFQSLGMALDLPSAMAQAQQSYQSATEREQTLRKRVYDPDPVPMRGGDIMASTILAVLPTILGAAEFGSKGAAMGSQVGLAGASPIIGGAAKRQALEREQVKAELDSALSAKKEAASQLQGFQKMGIQDVLNRGRDAYKEQLRAQRPGKADTPAAWDLDPIISGDAPAGGAVSKSASPPLARPNVKPVEVVTTPSDTAQVVDENKPIRPAAEGQSPTPKVLTNEDYKSSGKMSSIVSAVGKTDPQYVAKFKTADSTGLLFRGDNPPPVEFTKEVAQIFPKYQKAARAIVQMEQILSSVGGDMSRLDDAQMEGLRASVRSAKQAEKFLENTGAATTYVELKEFFNKSPAILGLLTSTDPIDVVRGKLSEMLVSSDALASLSSSKSLLSSEVDDFMVARGFLPPSDESYSRVKGFPSGIAMLTGDKTLGAKRAGTKRDFESAVAAAMSSMRGGQ